jgi:hypothetical protein
MKSLFSSVHFKHTMSTIFNGSKMKDRQRTDVDSFTVVSTPFSHSKGFNVELMYEGLRRG